MDLPVSPEETDIIMVPYTTVDGIPTFADSELAEIYQKIVGQGSERWLFFDGTIKDEQSFVARIKGPMVFTWVILQATTGEQFGVAFLDGVRGRTAFVHYCFFYRAWVAGSVEIGKKAFEHVFQNYPFDMLYGLVPIQNKSSIAFSGDVGGIRIGEIPKSVVCAENDMPESSIMFYFTGDKK
jgi:hypothetical protein